MRQLFRSSLSVHLQLRRTEKPNVVFPIRTERCHQLLVYHLLCLILRYDRGIHHPLYAWAAGSGHILRPRLDSHLHFGTILNFDFRFFYDLKLLNEKNTESKENRDF